MKNQGSHRLAAVATALTFTGMAYSSYAADEQNNTKTDSDPSAASTIGRVDDYLMLKETEIAMARSAAPPAIAANATILVLTPNGYATASQGTNGFTCLVERSWMSPFSSVEFWNPKMLGPVCYNPAASQSILAYTVRRTQLALDGQPKSRMLDNIRIALEKGEIPQPAPGAMSFMLSKDGRLGDTLSQWHPHLMVHVPKVDGATWGANVPGSPVVFDSREVPEPQAIFMIPVDHWSDGSAANAH
jgi:hypothetical protein